MKGSSLVGCWLGSWLHVAAGIIIVASLRERKQFPHGAEKRKTFRTVRKSGKLSAACGKAENFPQRAEKRKTFRKRKAFPLRGGNFPLRFWRSKSSVSWRVRKN
jgi:hypothetical protein